MIDIWLVRHAQSQNNANPESQRQPDPPLTSLGHWQAEAVGRHLHDSGPFAQRFVSAFRRALETAAPFHHAAQPAYRGFQIWTELFEVGGCFSGYAPHPRRAESGMTVEEVRQHFPWANPPAAWLAGGWNSLTEFETMEAAIPRADRVKLALENMALDTQQRLGSEPTSTNPERVLIVSHGEFIALLLSRLLTGEPNYFVRPRSIYNTSISKVRISVNNDHSAPNNSKNAQLKCQLLELNQIAHLSPGAISN
ncbi:MAG: histidine phosphatase family protein [Planctomycetaceae bacterium]|nr:histidine phosphatase family protein [Planctomycetaceae bacterium]